MALSEERTDPSRVKSLDAEELREVLSRAVRKFCPASIFSQQEDLVQVACLRILRRQREDEEFSSFEASYLWKVAHSVVADEVRRRMRRPESPLAGPADLPGALPSPEDSHEASRVREMIAAGLGTLKDSRRRAVLLYLQGFSLEESARILGWTVKRVDNQRYQGLTRLRRYLARRGVTP